ncbi:sensor histidine kinase regulating citrate/malate metabolism [Leucobacter exalbidus]|uniref:histidine kinase n=1 Tax=Leucobacter exalbidus TaxID=662960 RepID=A0A940PMK6_9MICO|nr:ATP-binding protein [Leucobacter exalbidus]MBP1325870.1 sensor histidine kinase regulating citrate/malate metabolism [Leucobacter exalbidus]
MVSRRTRSASSSVFVVLLAVVVILGLAVGGLLTWDRQRAESQVAERVTQGIATVVSISPEVRAELAIGHADPSRFPSVSAHLQVYARSVIEEANLEYVTIMTPTGTRYTHRDAVEIGGSYIGTIPDTPRAHTEVFGGTLGPSIRTIAPVLGEDGTLIGWVAVGVALNTVGVAIVAELPIVVAITLAFVAAGFVGALVGRRFTRNLTGGLTSAAVRDATSSYESIRTLGAAIRSQHHEHGNRMHAAVGLLELGRTDDAIAMLAETGRRERDLVNALDVQATGDPTMSALMLGKTAQGRELGIELLATIDPLAPKQPLRPIDAVSVVGNLIDNAFDAAADGDAPRTVHVDIRGDASGALVIDVTDSGQGFTAESRERMFEQDFSTKPAGTEGRGMGLALIHRIVENAGGTIQLDEDPTTLRVTLPGGSR